MYNGKKIIHIVARGMDGEIGANNKLLWDIPEDLRFFKESTIGHVVLMGRKTYESLPKPLERRVVVRVSRTPVPITKGVTYNLCVQDFLNVAIANLCKHLNTDCIFVAGGSKLYNSTFNIVDELWVTQVEKEYPEADTFYHIPEGFELVDEFYGDDCESVDVGYSFQKWVKTIDTQN